MTAASPTVVAMPADPVLTTRPSSVASTRLLVQLLGRATVADRSAWLLPVTALGVASALCLSVAGGAHFFFTTEGEAAGLYRILALLAVVLLLVPLASLAVAATRLATTRRDTRLSSLRLLGASTSTLRLLTLAETGVTAVAGALFGVLGYLALMPVFGLLHFAGGPIGVKGMWLGPMPVLAGLVGIVLVAVLASAVGLRQVAISPLGVRTRQQPKRVGLWRLAIATAALVGGAVLATALQMAPDMLVLTATAVVMVLLPLLAIDIIGPLLVSAVARRDARRARTATGLLAARAMLEDPRQLWRQIGALGMTSFVAVLTGVGMAFASSDASAPQEMILMHDIRTGVLVTLGITFMTVACSLGITQTAAVLDRRALYVGLDMVGMPIGRIDAARRRGIMRPLGSVTLFGAAAAMVLLLPLTVAEKVVDFWALVVVAGVLAGGLVLVAASLRLGRGALTQVLRAGMARAE